MGIMTKISIIFPSRMRARKSHETALKWREQAGEGVDLELILSIDRNDPSGDRYKLYHRATADKIVHEQNKSAVQAINRAAEVATGDIFIVVSDDTRAFEGWGIALLRELVGKKDFMLKTQDGIQPWIITMPVLDRDYYNRTKYIYHPEFDHMFCDTFLTCVADLTGRKLTSKLVFPHDHYSVTKEKPDEVNRRADATWGQGESTFIKLANQNFLLSKEDIKGKITDRQYINWMKSKGLNLTGLR